MENICKAEALIAFLVANEKFSIDDITVHSRGTFERNYNNDIHDVNVSGTRLDVYVNREGLYDMLPEGVFHEPVRRTGKSTEEVVDESQRYREEEKYARDFFLPLEQEFYRHKIKIEERELNEILQPINHHQFSSFIQFWGISPKIFGIAQCNFLVSVLPYLNAIVGNLDVVEHCLQIVMEQSIKIKASSPEEVHVLNNDLLSVLGDCCLSTDMISGAIYMDDEVGLEVIVGPVSLDKLPKFVTGGIADIQLKTLYAFFFPADIHIKTTIIADNREKMFTLFEDKGFSRLGYSTILQETLIEL